MLTDHQEWSRPPLPLPLDPAAWYQLASGGGWQAVVADSAHPVAYDVVAARVNGLPSLTAAWCELPCAVPVLCAPATGPGVTALQTAVRAALAEGLPLRRMVVVLTSMSEGRLPSAVRAAATMLRPQVGAVVGVPFDPHIRSHGLDAPDRLSRRTYESGAGLVAAVLASADRSWGDPLPPAPVPAALPVAPLPAPARPARPAPEGALT
ncbi:hypothetical protein ACFQ7N_38295 [Streptomyces niveus]|uniref:hypothetical protein n=1 Tax=Streptomyces niveus TaxID=193462 RepID=UPI0036B600D1